MKGRGRVLLQTTLAVLTAVALAVVLWRRCRSPRQYPDDLDGFVPAPPAPGPDDLGGTARATAGRRDGTAGRRRPRSVVATAPRPPLPAVAAAAGVGTTHTIAEPRLELRSEARSEPRLELRPAPRPEPEPELAVRDRGWEPERVMRRAAGNAASARFGRAAGVRRASEVGR